MQVKVTVQFETEGNGQNEIVSLMDRSKVRLHEMSYAEQDLKQNNFTGSGLKGTPKLLKAHFLETIFMSKL